VIDDILVLDLLKLSVRGLTESFFLIDNTHMSRNDYLRVGIAYMSPVRVISRLCLFPSSRNRPDKKIRKTFQSLRELVVMYGLDPDTLLHIGIPTTDKDELITYECCLEFPLPIDIEDNMVGHKTLPDGQYAILRIKKKLPEISRAIRQLYADYIPENQIMVDEMRPVYEIYDEDTLKYCVPIIDR
jgi:DNA gyrase inhibitor GyrI